MTTPLALVFETMPPTDGGGCAPRGNAFARALVDNGRFGPLVVYTTTSNPTPIEGVELRTLGDRSGSSQDQRLSRRLAGEAAFGLRVAWAVLRSSRATVWMFSTPSYVAMLFATIAARLRGSHYVLDVRDIYPQAYIAAGLINPKGLVARVLSSLSKRAYRRATTMLAATEGLRVTLQGLASETKVHTIINGFTVNRANINAVPRERFTVCFHGVLGYFQDSASLVEIGRRLEQYDIDMVVIGYGRDAHMFKDISAPNIKFLGRLPHDRTMMEVARCHVGLSLRKDEEISADSFPVKVWEYLGLGMPTLVAPSSDAGRFVEQHGCGYMLAAGNVEEAVSRIVELRDNPDLYRAASERAALAVAPFSRAAQSQKMAEILAYAMQDLPVPTVLRAPQAPNPHAADTQETSRRARPE